MPALKQLRSFGYHTSFLASLTLATWCCLLPGSARAISVGGEGGATSTSGAPAVVLASDPMAALAIKSTNQDFTSFAPTYATLGNPVHGFSITFPNTTLPSTTLNPGGTFLLDYAASDAITAVNTPFGVTINGSIQISGLPAGVTAQVTVAGGVAKPSTSTFLTNTSQALYNVTSYTSPTTYNVSGASQNITLGQPYTSSTDVLYEDVQILFTNTSKIPVSLANVSIDPTVNCDVVITPEPSTLVLIGFGLAFLFIARRRALPLPTVA